MKLFWITTALRLTVNVVTGVNDILFYDNIVASADVSLVIDLTYRCPSVVVVQQSLALYRERGDYTCHNPRPFTVDSTVNTGNSLGTSIALDVTDDNAVIAYASTGGGLKLVRCINFYCVDKTVIFPGADEESKSYSAGGRYPSLAVGSDNVPVMSFLFKDGTGTTLIVMHCGDRLCSTRSIFRSKAVGLVGYTSLALSKNNLPRVSFTNINGNLELLLCNNPDCTDSGTVVAYNQGFSIYQSLKIDRNNIPVVSYSNKIFIGNINKVKLSRCSDPTCSGTIITRDIYDSDGGVYVSLALDCSIYPVISYTRSSGVTVAHCVDEACAQQSINANVYNTNPSTYTSLALYKNRNPVVIFVSTNGLAAASCGDKFCGSPSAMQIETCPTPRPTSRPTQRPTEHPTQRPTEHPTQSPTPRPTNSPTSVPSSSPSTMPSSKPSVVPTSDPSMAPSSGPSVVPSSSPVMEPRAGSVRSQGDKAMYAHRVRRFYKATGDGSKIGVISNSFNCTGGADVDIAMGNLPATIEVLKDLNSTMCKQIRIRKDRGCAMMQSMHDVAPGARFMFWAAESEDDMAVGIRALADAGCNIIVDDVHHLLEPVYQDGVVAQAIDDVVESQNVSYFTAAGNYRNNAWEAPNGFVDTGGGEHNFGMDGDEIVEQKVTVETDGSLFKLVLQWDEPWKSVPGSVGSSSDLQLIARDSRNGKEYISDHANIGEDPYEIVEVDLGPSGARVDLYFTIMFKSGPTKPRHMRVYSPNNVVFQFGTDTTPDIYGHANSANVAAVGAAWWRDTPYFGAQRPMIEHYSSIGSTPIVFQNNGTRYKMPIYRQQPLIVGPDRCATSFFGPKVGRRHRHSFAGTSSAVAHVAGVAALMSEMSGQALSADDMYEMLGSTAVDMDVTGYDNITGYGFVDALAAAREAGQAVTAACVDETKAVCGCKALCGYNYIEQSCLKTSVYSALRVYRRYIKQQCRKQ